ncbi:hypothetical protein [Streptomyces sp. NBC_01800]|uniref:hypothetical protein n=1 Tax=Streptomyces sp. NBC_01800 TaxID=2975945 RepID=UPI002DD90318|nr:hypothetical protein [Streptomyces sp. NBC_01800]
MFGLGALALTAGTAAAALCVNTLYTGPLARVLGGVDLALPVGIAVASAVYATLMRRSRDGLGMAQRAWAAARPSRSRGSDRGSAATTGAA